MWTDLTGPGPLVQAQPVTTRRRLLALLAVAALAVSACSEPGGAPANSSSGTAPRLVRPSDFAAEVSRGERFVLNVHIPDEGSIEGTDASIPFDQLDERAAELPQDRSTPLAVYCRTGRMSTIAVETLTQMGFRDVVELDGGMEAWSASGRTLLPSATSSPGITP